MIYQAKLYLIAANYANNSQLSNPTDYIDDQFTGNWNQWDYGFSHMNDTGCEIFAMFNFFISQGKHPHLATMIALTQLLNADMCFGIWGTNPWPEQYISLLCNTASAALPLLTPIITTVVIPVVSAVITADYISDHPTWAQCFLWPLYPGLVDLTITGLNTAFVTALAVVLPVGNVLYSYYLKYWHSIDDVLFIYGGVTNIQTRMAFDSFNNFATSETSSYGSYIISFWNELYDGTHVPNPNKELHTVFVMKPQKTVTSFVGYNVSMNGTDGEDHPRSSISDFIDKSLPQIFTYKFSCGLAIGA